MTAPLLVEILTEELPPLSLKKLSESFAVTLFEALRVLEFLEEGARATPYATPRRLAVLIDAVRARQPERDIERRGPAVAAAINGEGKPAPSLIGFARSCGVEIAALERVGTDKGDYFVFRRRQSGENLEKHLVVAVETAVKKLPTPKLMRWGAGETQFVRPVHGVVMLHGKRVVPGTVLGHKAGRVTRGHRVLSKGTVRLTSAGDYIEALRGQGRVLVDFPERRNEIERQLREAARDLREGTILFAADADLRADRSAAAQEALAIARHNDALLDEVTALVEWPVVYRGDFDAEFLRVPGACLALAMQRHQRYFPLLHPQQPGFLFPHFLVVSNMQASDPGEIVHGNERVLRARLADARFFFEQDQKTPLAARVPRLERVVYHNKLGSQFERVTRVQRIATEIARRLGLADEDIRRAERAAFLCKADLLTEMVGEFPELQGVMGARYALHDGEDAAVAAAIREHYQPRFAGGHLPAGAIGLCIALADRLEAMIGLFGVGQAPTGDKDPFGLRRAAAGVVRMMIEGKSWIKTPVTLDLRGLLDYTHMQFTAGVMADGTVDAVSAFIYERLRSYLREGEREFAADEIEAVLVLKPTRLDELLPRLEALRVFRSSAAGAALAAANKRISNILRQAGQTAGNSVNPDLLRENEEQTLWQRLAEESGAARADAERGDYSGSLARLATLREPVDRFFDKVLVMADDRALRDNRLALLAAVRAAFQHVADISQLQIAATGVTERL